MVKINKWGEKLMNNEEELDLIQAIKISWKKRKIIFGIIIACVLIGLVYTFIINRPIYQSTSKILIDKADASISEFVKSNDIMAEVASNFNVQRSYISEKATVSFDKNTKILTISVSSTDNKEALNSNADTLDSRIAGGEFRVVGQVDKTYIIIETPNKEILFIDQHAAHERILFEKIQSDNAAKPKPSIVLHDAVEVVMTDEIIENIDRYKVIIESFGYAYKITGIDKLEILRVPYNIIRKNIAKEFTNIAADLCLTGKSKQEEAPRAMLSCKSAIKAGDELTYAEMEYLVTLLFNTDNFGTCPHGRPIIYMMTVQELARKFYR